MFVSESDRKWVCVCVRVCVSMHERKLHLSLGSGRALPESFCVSLSKGHVLHFHSMWQSDLSDHPILISHIIGLFVVYNLFDLCTRWAIRCSFEIDDPCGTKREHNYRLFP